MSQKDKETWEYLAKTLPEIQEAYTNEIGYYESDYEGTSNFAAGWKRRQDMIEKIKKCKELVDERLSRES